MSGNGITLPKAPKELCFSELDFIQDNFDIDAFLQEHRKTTKLETMRDDLGMYLKLLRSAMIDLINRDYTDFVNLSSNLIGLDKAINDLQAPLGQLREEAMQVRQTLDDEIAAISDGLNENAKIRQYKQSLYSLQHIYKSLGKLSAALAEDAYMDSPVKIDILEQAAAEFNQLKFHTSRCKLDIITEKEKETEKLEESYMACLSGFFLTCVHEKNSALTIRCLRIYVTLDKVPDAEELIRKEVVSPLIENVISVDSSRLDQPGLRSIYNSLLNILSIELKQLLDITLCPEKASVKGFNFLVNSFWVEAEEKIEQYMKCIFAPGDPVLFHGRYCATLEFLEKLEAECTAAEALAALKGNPRYKDFLKKWNLPVYFQIRFQEIAGAVEATLTESVSPALVSGTLDRLTRHEFSLRATTVVWENLQRIWADDVYLHQLFDRFWKFSLRMCARYQTWAAAVLKEPWPVENELGTSGKSERSTRLNFLICLYKDLEKLMKTVPSLTQTALSKLKGENGAVRGLLQDSLGETVKGLEAVQPLVTDQIQTELLKESVDHLRQVSDIPRLFRRTKRDVPTKPCGYVKNSLAFLTNFHGDYKKHIPENVNRWLESSLSLLTEHYLKSVTDVLTSVQKTEESLRRLKKIRDKSTGSLPSEAQGVTDDEKIRIQLRVDVQAYVAMISELDVLPENVHHLSDLTRTVETAIKK